MLIFYLRNLAEKNCNLAEKNCNLAEKNCNLAEISATLQFWVFKNVGVAWV